MKKLGLILGVAAVAAVSGCLDPNYVKSHPRQGDEVKPAAPVPEQQPVEPVQAVEIKPISEESAPAPVPVAEVKPVPAPAPAEPETTVYIVQRGDFLAKISKKYNVTLASIRRLNPQIKNDVIKIGQKIKLPGKIDVGEQKAPAPVAAKASKPAAKEYKPYVGDTKEYVVKSGDTLGAIAYGNGITIRQLKELNGLSSTGIRVGQKLKIPAEKVAAAAKKPAPVKAAPAAAPVVEANPEAQPAVASAPVVAEPAPAPEASVAPLSEAAAKPAAEEGVTYVVKEGEDLIDLSARFSLSPSEIRSLNNLGEDDKLVPGQVLKLPAETQF